MFNNRFFSKIAAALGIMFLLGCVSFYPILFAQDDGAIFDDEEWTRQESDFFIIYCDSSINLYDLERELTKRPLCFDQTAKYGEVVTFREICRRLDNLYNRAQDVLNMYPEMPKIKINIFRDRDELNDEFFKIFGKESDFKSFYVYEHNTIYTSEREIEDSVIIHETAHAIIDHYFSVVPPETVGEILAAYVDAHLEG
jgi:hypothetical protein